MAATAASTPQLSPPHATRIALHLCQRSRLVNLLSLSICCRSCSIDPTLEHHGARMALRSPCRRLPPRWRPRESLPLRTACPCGGVVAVVFRPRTAGVSVAAQRRVVAVAAETAPAARGDEVGTPFMDEMRAAAMRLHSRDQAARDGKKEAQGPMEPPIAKWQPTVEGYLRFLVDSKLVFETLEAIVDRAAIPWYAEFRDTGLERSEPLGKDLEWFMQQGHAIPEPSAPGITYASFLEELSEKDPQAFVCHFYNVYFADTAVGRIIGEKVAEKINLQKELEFYEWEGDLSQMQQNVRARLNRVASGWSRAEKNRCLGEMEKAFTYSVDLCRHMFMFP